MLIGRLNRQSTNLYLKTITIEFLLFDLISDGGWQNGLNKITHTSINLFNKMPWIRIESTLDLKRC